MTSSLMGQGYTHKKFNCCYSHKKLGLRLREREQPNTENILSAQTETSKRCKNLFRPYDLDGKNTPRKRKMSTSSVNMEENTPATTSAVSNLLDQQLQHQQQNALNVTTTTCSRTATTPLHFGNYFAFGPNPYNIRLQRCNAALYEYYMHQVWSDHAAVTIQSATGYAMGYPNVTAPIFNEF